MATITSSVGPSNCPFVAFEYLVVFYSGVVLPTLITREHLLGQVSNGLLAEQFINTTIKTHPCTTFKKK